MRSVVTEDGELDFAASAEAVEYPILSSIAYAMKGGIDRLAAALILAVLAVPMLVIAGAVKLSSPGPVLVRQVRVGRWPSTTFFARSATRTPNKSATAWKLQQPRHATS
jgi:lipopolysaccharide/colanic/teichoic acid biosynthesis glycosyltransferase